MDMGAFYWGIDSLLVATPQRRVTFPPAASHQLLVALSPRVGSQGPVPIHASVLVITHFQVTLTLLLLFLKRLCNTLKE